MDNYLLEDEVQDPKTDKELWKESTVIYEAIQGILGKEDSWEGFSKYQKLEAGISGFSGAVNYSNSIFTQYRDAKANLETNPNDFDAVSVLLSMGNILEAFVSLMEDDTLLQAKNTLVTWQQDFGTEFEVNVTRQVESIEKLWNSLTDINTQYKQLTPER